MKLDPILGYFCISNHNQKLNDYGDMHHSSWKKRTSFVTQMRSGTTKRRTTLAEWNLGDPEDSSGIRETYWLLAIQATREASRLEGIHTQPVATVQNNIYRGRI